MSSADSELKCLAVLLQSPAAVVVGHPGQPVAVFVLATVASLGVALLPPGTVVAVCWEC